MEHAWLYAQVKAYKLTSDLVSFIVFRISCRHFPGKLIERSTKIYQRITILPVGVHEC
ncbi:MAG: hypothetical protein N2317_05305 [Syntrophales bacterium]|nr:hypothetical protein [Syntrophales bacterium]